MDELKFETEFQALDYVHANELDNKTFGFCPAIKENCKGRKCAAFEKARAYEFRFQDKSHLWRVAEPYCKNPMVSGFIEIDGGVWMNT